MQYQDPLAARSASPSSSGGGAPPSSSSSSSSSLLPELRLMPASSRSQQHRHHGPLSLADRHQQPHITTALLGAHASTSSGQSSPPPLSATPAAPASARAAAAGGDVIVIDDDDDDDDDWPVVVEVRPPPPAAAAGCGALAEKRVLQRKAALLQVVEGVRSLDEWLWFDQPVPRRFHHYHRTIAQPMDMSTIAHRVLRGDGGRGYRPCELLQDMALLARNASAFNGHDSPFADTARTMLTAATQHVQALEESGLFQANHQHNDDDSSSSSQQGPEQQQQQQQQGCDSSSYYPTDHIDVFRPWDPARPLEPWPPLMLTAAAAEEGAVGGGEEDEEDRAFLMLAVRRARAAADADDKDDEQQKQQADEGEDGRAAGGGGPSSKRRRLEARVTAATTIHWQPPREQEKEEEAALWRALAEHRHQSDQNLGGVKTDEAEEEEGEGGCARCVPYRPKKEWQQGGRTCSRTRGPPPWDHDTTTTSSSSTTGGGPQAAAAAGGGRSRRAAVEEEEAEGEGGRAWQAHALVRRAGAHADSLLRVGASGIHGLGVFAKKKIHKGSWVVEYVGEVVRRQVAERREQRYRDCRIKDLYQFSLGGSGEEVLDATRKGNVARLINHSCMPNLRAALVQPLLGPQQGGRARVVLIAKRDVLAGEELVYDYQLPEERAKLPCRCKAKHCRGWLN